MDDLVTTSSLITSLAVLCAAVAIIGVWYVRTKLSGAEQRMTVHVDERLSLVADRLSTVIDSRLDRAERDMAMSTAAIKDALRQVERAEMGQLAMQRSIESLGVSVTSLREDLAQARIAGAARNPATVTDIADLRHQVESLRGRVVELGERDQLFATLVRGWGAGGGKA
jgi:hypothetical protein